MFSGGAGLDGGEAGVVGGGGNVGLKGGALLPSSGGARGGGMSFETPPPPRSIPVHCGDFVVPVVRNRAQLCFDLPREIEARRVIFESIAVGGGGSDGAGVCAGAGQPDAGGWVSPALSLSGRIQCYR